jgi:hypothetical protein
VLAETSDAHYHRTLALNVALDQSANEEALGKFFAFLGKVQFSRRDAGSSDESAKAVGESFGTMTPPSFALANSSNKCGVRKIGSGP